MTTPRYTARLRVPSLPSGFYYWWVDDEETGRRFVYSTPKWYFNSGMRLRDFAALVKR